MHRYLPYLLGAAVGALLLFVLAWPDSPAAAFPASAPVLVTPTQMAAVAPDTQRGIIERAATRRVHASAEAIAFDVEHPQAGRFVALSRLRLATIDSIDAGRDSVIEARSLGEYAVLQYASRFDDQLEIYTVGSDRTIRRHVFDASCTPIETVIDGSDVRVQEGRWCWLDTLLGAAGVGAVGYGAGAASWEFVAGGIAALAIRKLIF